jgi:hypothetical protein
MSSWQITTGSFFAVVDTLKHLVMYYELIQVVYLSNICYLIVCNNSEAAKEDTKENKTSPGVDTSSNYQFIVHGSAHIMIANNGSTINSTNITTIDKCDT